MANAKLWWNGSAWSPSETYWVNLNTTGSMWCGILVKLQIIAYDDGTVRFYGPLGKTSGDEFFEGSKNIYVDGTRYVYSQTNTTVDVSGISSTARVYTTGSLACWVARSGRYNGNPWSANHDTTITDPFCSVTFKANDGSSTTFLTQKVCKNASCALTAARPARTGYTFLGWSLSASATTATYPAGGSITAAGDTVLFAVWSANSQILNITKPATASVSILRNGTSFTGNSVRYDDLLTISATPSPGYRITSLQVNGSDFVSGGTLRVTGDVFINVTTIAQSSTIATYDSSVETLGIFTLTANRFSESHFSKLRYYDSNGTLLHTSDAFAESTSLVIPRSWFNDFGSLSAIPITAVLTTYTDPECTVITGVDDSCTFTVTADGGMKPVLSAGFVSLAPYNTGTGAENLTNPGYVKGYSKVQAVFDTAKITHAAGASAAAYAITVQGVSTSGSGTTVLSSNKVTSSGTLTITCTVTDSRGRSTSGTETISVSDYSNPAIASLNCYRCDYSGQEDENDPYMAVTPACTFTPLADNAITIEIFVKPTGGSYASCGATPNTQRKIIGGSFLADTSYYVKVTVTDTVGNSAYTEMSMPRRSWDFHIRHTANGAGAAFGKVTEHDRTLQLASGWDLMLGATSMTEADLVYLLGLDDLIGSTTLPTTAQTITGAIDEIAAGGGGGLTDVTVDGVSVVSGGVAAVDLSGKSDLGHRHTAADITDLPAGLRMEKLWTNPEPAAYAAQTEALDLSGYDAVLIRTLNDRGSNTPQFHAELIFVGDSGVCFSSNASTTGYTYKRQADVTAAGVSFGGGFRNTSAGSGYAVPQTIYGIRGIA